MITMQLAHHTAHTATLLAGTGILDTANEKAAALQVTLRAVASVASIFFVIKQAVSSGGAIARIVIAGLAAGTFVWIVFNVTDLKDRVGTEVTAAGPAVSQQALQPGHQQPGHQLPGRRPLLLPASTALA